MKTLHITSLTYPSVNVGVKDAKILDIYNSQDYDAQQLFDTLVSHHETGYLVDTEDNREWLVSFGEKFGVEVVFV